MRLVGEAVEALAKYFSNWAAKRNSLSASQVLKQRNLFIFPTKLGGYYLMLITLIWLLGTNYENNAILALSYLLLSIFIICIFHCFFNMQGLVVESTQPKIVQSGETADIELIFKASKATSHHSIQACWRGDQDHHLIWHDLVKQTLTLPLATSQRGLLRAPTLLLASVYPFGLIRCWSYLAMHSYAIVYPKPIDIEQPQRTHRRTQQNNLQNSHQVLQGEQEFHSLDLYRQGEPLSQIAWKQYARTNVLYKKNSVENASSAEHHQLRWDDYPGVDVELRLAYLCHQALALHRQQLAYSLVLPNESLAQNSGDSHLQQVLQVLALFDVALPDSSAVSSALDARK